MRCSASRSASAALRLGGRRGRDFTVAAGDVVALPAGTGHKRIASSRHFLVVGAYPEGRDRDLIKPYATPAAVHDAALQRIAALPCPSFDPVEGRAVPSRAYGSADLGEGAAACRDDLVAPLLPCGGTLP